MKKRLLILLTILCSCGQKDIHDLNSFYQFNGTKRMPLIYPYELYSQRASSNWHIHSNLALGKKMNISGLFDSINVEYPYIILVATHIYMKPQKCLVFNVMSDSLLLFMNSNELHPFLERNGISKELFSV